MRFNRWSSRGVLGGDAGALFGASGRHQRSVVAGAEPSTAGAHRDAGQRVQPAGVRLGRRAALRRRRQQQPRRETGQRRGAAEGAADRRVRPPAGGGHRQDAQPLRLPPLVRRQRATPPQRTTHPQRRWTGKIRKSTKFNFTFAVKMVLSVPPLSLLPCGPFILPVTKYIFYTLFTAKFNIVINFH